MKYTAVNVDNGTVGIVDEYSYVSNNFLYGEFACNDGSGTILYSGRLVHLIQAIRDIVGPLRINSAYRTPEYNESIGGSSKSQHIMGVAVDLSIPNGYTSDSFYDLVEKVAGQEVGIGKYSSFVHLDLRGYKSRWNG